MAGLTEATRNRVNHLLDKEDRPKVVKLLDGLEGGERVRFAALKLGKANLKELRKLVAKQQCRFSERCRLRTRFGRSS